MREMGEAEPRLLVDDRSIGVKQRPEARLKRALSSSGHGHVGVTLGTYDAFGLSVRRSFVLENPLLCEAKRLFRQ